MPEWVVFWSLLALSGAGTRSSNWFERLCCLVGWAWIVMGLLVVPFIWYSEIKWITTSGINW